MRAFVTLSDDPLSVRLVECPRCGQRIGSGIAKQISGETVVAVNLDTDHVCPDRLGA